jgi:hypothetical protein
MPAGNSPQCSLRFYSDACLQKEQIWRILLYNPDERRHAHLGLELKPGSYNLHIGVMDRDSNKIGTLEVPLWISREESNPIPAPNPVPK